MEKRSFGRTGENSAAIYLQQQGFEIIGHNIYAGRVEIDIIAKNAELFLFVEVKTRRQKPGIKSIYGRPANAVTQKKKQNLLNAATRYMYENPGVTGSLQPRIDLVEVYADPNAMEYRVLDIIHFPNIVHR